MSRSNRTIAFWRQTILSVCVRAHIRRSSFADATWTVYLYYFKFYSVEKSIHNLIPYLLKFYF